MAGFRPPTVELLGDMPSYTDRIRYGFIRGRAANVKRLVERGRMIGLVAACRG